MKYKVFGVILMGFFILVSTVILNTGYEFIDGLESLFGIRLIVEAFIGVIFEIIGIIGIGASAIAIEHILGGD